MIWKHSNVSIFRDGCENSTGAPSYQLKCCLIFTCALIECVLICSRCIWRHWNLFPKRLQSRVMIMSLIMRNLNTTFTAMNSLMMPSSLSTVIMITPIMNSIISFSSKMIVPSLVAELMSLGLSKQVRRAVGIRVLSSLHSNVKHLVALLTEIEQGMMLFLVPNQPHPPLLVQQKKRNFACSLNEVEPGANTCYLAPCKRTWHTKTAPSPKMPEMNNHLGSLTMWSVKSKRIPTWPSVSTLYRSIIIGGMVHGKASCKHAQALSYVWSESSSKLAPRSSTKTRVFNSGNSFAGRDNLL